MDSKEPTFDIPEFYDFSGLCQYLGIEPFPYTDIHFQKIESKGDHYKAPAKPFKHRFYAISLLLEGEGVFNSGFLRSTKKKNVIYIKTPYQIVSWNFDPEVTKKYAVIFTENFINRHQELANIIFDFPFFQLDKAIPLNVNETDVAQLTNVFENIHQLYQTKSTEQFNLIAAYIKILLLHTKQMYENSLISDKELVSTVETVRDRLIDNFLAQVKKDIHSLESRDFSVAYFADKLSTHPNHLSATLKKYTGKTAQEHIHTALLAAAKTLLVQTEYSIKEIAYRLSFKEPSHFANFFKKWEKITPLQYRKSTRL
ncbi:helix-turn-helix transcriptional regulator [Chryseobacterium sp. L7]|uniref:Helix-turn-helix transcriptional regulator n=1 Tax=Chryseobacterium endalhagicum TaxID=2797638 RepID=A0ABS1QC98_9FLAO|nr:helix-turn-helix domain-containing protein [Chryseobacterium endalhagicum]MBL1220250.1 helix-turn-helix transcriptional regulator [Chryseobacterium endalhagicum]